ncbi:MAG: glycine cleavage system protein T [Candidatus Stahlbacteria bacterium]|nr:glycine cleavage system protein T [Candidatus Stahlbacteria bacterium]
MLKRTAFYDAHIKAGGKVVPFAGFEMPIQYKGIMNEVKSVRSKVGIFDVSHMGRVEVTGSGAFDFVSQITTNDPAKLAIFQAQYSCMCYEDGGIVDDLVVYRLKQGDTPCLQPQGQSRQGGIPQNTGQPQKDNKGDKFLLVINGANKKKDWKWISEHKGGFCALQNQNVEVRDWGAECVFVGIPAFISRTGYSGEDGFEVYFDAKHPELWDKVLAQGVVPIGLGARDVLRLEMKYCLYGNDIDKTTTPLEAGLGWITKLDKPDFIGKSALVRQKEAGIKRKLVAFVMESKSIPRQHYHIYRTPNTDNRIIGEVTSGNFSPSINQPIGLGYVNTPYDKVDTEIEIDCRGKLEKAKIITPPFYKHATHK